jgi:hypothetical protein
MTTEGNEKGKDSINLQKNLHTDLPGYARIIKNVGTSHETPREEMPSEVKICFSSRSSAVQCRSGSEKKEGGIEDVRQLFPKQRTDVERNRRVCSLKQAGCIAGFMYLLCV